MHALDWTINIMFVLNIHIYIYILYTHTHKIQALQAMCFYVPKTQQKNVCFHWIPYDWTVNGCLQDGFLYYVFLTKLKSLGKIAVCHLNERERGNRSNKWSIGNLRQCVGKLIRIVVIMCIYSFCDIHKVPVCVLLLWIWRYALWSLCVQDPAQVFTNETKTVDVFFLPNKIY